MRRTHQKGFTGARCLQTGGRENGATVVESAIIFPLVVLLLVGILDGALLSRSYLSANNAANGGARVGGVEGQADTSDYGILQAVARDASGASGNQIAAVIVYNATVPGAGPSQSCIDHANAQNDVGVAGQCNVYTNADLSRPASDFTSGNFQADQYFQPQQRSISFANPTYLGVWVHVQCKCLSSLFGLSPDLHATSVVQVEPSAA